MGKITTISNDLENMPKFCCPEENLIFKFTEFSTLSEDDVRKSIISVETKSFESDILPTFFLKNLDKLLPSLTNIVNLSLQNRIFAAEWKKAILRPLIKNKIMFL